MPSSKLAFLRYLLIDRMLRDKMKQFPTKQELLEACHEKYGVRSISTIEKDLNAMRLEFDAPIEYHPRLKGYHYTDSKFQILSSSSNLSESNLLALSFVETLLEEFKFMPIFSEFSDAVDKVLDGLEITRSFNNDVKSVGKFIRFDKSAYFKGSDVLSKLIKVITEKKVIELEYKKFNSENTKTYTLHPYLLKEFDNLWYLTGYVEDYKEVRTFGIDRIENFEITKEYLIPQSEIGFDAETFFSNCYGITALSDKSEKIILSFTPFQGNYIKAQPIHPSQEILEDNENEFRISLNLVNNIELRKLIMSYGEHVKVIAPDSLRKMIIDSFKKTLAVYD